MFVLKRDGKKEPVMFDKITARVRKLCYGLNPLVDPVKVAARVIEGLYDGVTTSELDNLAAEISATMTTAHPDFAKLAARISVSNLHKNTKKSFSDVMEDLHKYVNPRTGKKAPLLADDVYKVIADNKELLDSTIIYNRDFGYDYFGFKTLERSYLLKLNGEIAERPQHMLMRVAIGIHLDDMEAVIETYDLMSKKFFTHATPTLFNAGTPKPQMSSCFLLTMKDDSIEGIYDTLKQTAKISQSAGGIGLSIHNIRATGSYIAGTNGTSNGIVPMLQVFNDTARYVDQGGGKRKGSFAIYIEPWHADIFDFLDLKKNHGKEEMRARDLFYAMWVPDLFMKRVQENGEWTLMCPNECPGLCDVHADAFDKMYLKYEKEGKGRKTIKARELWEKILESQIETGTPYMLYKDAANVKSNQQNLGTIRSSNLCTEILEYTSPDEIAVCNLASIALPMFIKDGEFDHQELYRITKRVTKNLNRVIDRNYYPVKEAENSNFKHRPIGMGIMGFQDALYIKKIPYASEAAVDFADESMELVSYMAINASSDLAKERGSYSSYEGSLWSQGILPLDSIEILEKQRGKDYIEVDKTTRLDWDALREKVKTQGMRNSNTMAIAPTATIANITGLTQSIEPTYSNLFVKSNLSGEFTVINMHLVDALKEIDMWDEVMVYDLKNLNGSLESIARVPEDIKKLFATSFEVEPKWLIEAASRRQKWIDQSQSLNLYVSEPNGKKLDVMYRMAWLRGLKTTYYLRSRSATTTEKSTITNMELNAVKTEPKTYDQPEACSIDDPDCEACQ